MENRTRGYNAKHDRNYEVLKSYMNFNKQTEIAKNHNISVTRVRQILKQAKAIR